MNEPNLEPTEIVEPAVEAVAPAPPPDDLDARISGAIHRTLEEFQRRAQAGPVPSQDAASDALDAIDMREQLYEDALATIPESAKEAREALKHELRAFKTPAQLRQARAAGIHLKLADAAFGRAVREGRYSPEGTSSVTREPVHSEALPRISGGKATEIAAIETLLGVKFSPEEKQL